MIILDYPYKVATELTNEMKEDKSVLELVVKELINKAHGDKITSINTTTVKGKEVIQVVSE